MISGMTFGHNLLVAGYPIREAILAVRPFVDEIVAVDLQSTDGTRQLFEELGCRVLDDLWYSGAGSEPLIRAYERNAECGGDVILMFEADEVWDMSLVSHVTLDLIPSGIIDLTVTRIQVGLNFQRIRWYPHPVHRVFPRGGGSYRQNPVVPPRGLPHVGQEFGMVWDCSLCFRDNYWVRKAQQSELWGAARHIFVGDHFTDPFVEMTVEQTEQYLLAPEWSWAATPINIPEILRPLVGKTRYE